MQELNLARTEPMQLAKVDVGKVVINNIMSVSGAHLTRTRSESISSRPSALHFLAVCATRSGDVIEGISPPARVLVRIQVAFAYSVKNERRSPVEFRHAREEVYPVLTIDVIRHIMNRQFSPELRHGLHYRPVNIMEAVNLSDT